MRLLGLIVVLWSLSLAVASGFEIRPEFVMQSDPLLKIPDPVITYSEKLGPFWLKMLARPEAEVQHQVADAIMRAHQIGTPKLLETTPALTKIVAAETSHPAARHAAARTLIVMNVRDAAATLFEASQRHQSDLRQLIEPALAHWDYQPTREIWRRRLISRDSRPRELLLAIEALGQVRDTTSATELLKLVHDQTQSLPIRLAAAKAASQIQTTNLEQDSQQLLGTEPSRAALSNRLLAVHLLSHHQGATAQAALTSLARDAEPAVVTVALESLFRISPDLVLPLAEEAISSRDVRVRQQAAASYIARPTADRAVVLAKLLDDPDPSLRGEIRESLFRLAKTPEFDGPIRQSAIAMLAQNSWRGQEQAALLLTALDQKSVAPRFIELLESPRPEVMVTVAWGLRKLAVPETLPLVLSKVQQQESLRLKVGSTSDAADAQVGHLCELFGVMKYQPAEPTLRRFVPKNHALGELSRSSAIWSLGYLHQGVPDEPLAVLMVERLTEPGPAMPPEVGRVREACAISIARMKAKSQLQRMRDYLDVISGLDMTSLSTRWAIEELTGEKFPPLKPPTIFRYGRWALDPLDNPDTR